MFDTSILFRGYADFWCALFIGRNGGNPVTRCRPTNTSIVVLKQFPCFLTPPSRVYNYSPLEANAILRG